VRMAILTANYIYTVADSGSSDKVLKIGVMVSRFRDVGYDRLSVQLLVHMLRLCG
jgi:hypothetical protein